jgi:DinB superfamily
MPHPLVEQLRFTRSEFVRGMAGLSETDAQRRLQPMNSISWMIGHLAWQEQRYWLIRAQNQVLYPELNERLAYGKPASTPELTEIWEIWREVTTAADSWLDSLTNASVQMPLKEGLSSVGTFLLRTTYHYWYHLGEAMAVRQISGHGGLPDFVGDIDGLAPYRSE